MPEYTPQMSQAETMCNHMNFDNVAQYTSKASTSMPSVPYDQSKPLGDASIQTSNSQMIDVGPTAHDKTVGGT